MSVVGCMTASIKNNDGDLPSHDALRLPFAETMSDLKVDTKEM